MTLWNAHDRTDDHNGLEPLETVQLSVAIGQYEVGANLADVLASMAARLSSLEYDWTTGFTRFGLDAVIAPYDLGTVGDVVGFVGINAVISDTVAGSIGLDAETVATVLTPMTAVFGLDAYVVDPGSGVSTTYITADVDATQTTITVNSASGFPTSGDYLIQIDGETMLVVGGQGTTTWTVIRGYGGPMTTTHTAGALVIAC